MNTAPSPLRGAVAASYVCALWEFLDARGLDSRGILGEPRPDLQAAPGRFPVDRWKALLEKAADALDAPDLGLQLGQTIRARHFGLIGYVVLACDTLGAALQRLDRYQRLAYDVSPMRLLPGQHQLTLEWGSEAGRPGRLVDETAITALIQLARDLTGVPATIEYVQFINAPPKHPEAFEAFFGGKVAFDCPTTQVRLPISLLSTQLRQPDAALRELLEQQARALMAQLPGVSDLEQSVRRAITEGVGNGAVSLDQVAERLHTAPRTLHRHLDGQGLRFRQLRDDTLRRLAEQRLSDPGISIAEVAQMLGFSEQSAFTRAFKRWTGVSPNGFRQKRQRR